MVVVVVVQLELHQRFGWTIALRFPAGVLARPLLLDASDTTRR